MTDDEQTIAELQTESQITLGLMIDVSENFRTGGMTAEEFQALYYDLEARQRAILDIYNALTNDQ